MSASTSSRKRTAPLLIAGGGLAVCLCLLAALGLGGYWFFHQEQSTVAPPAVVYILDASPRMAQATEGGTRLSVAQAVLAEIVRPADTSVAAALRVFGTGAVEAACQDTDLLVPLAAASQGQIAQTLSTVEASATSVDSALAAAMIAGIRDLAQTNGPHTLVVVTGGADSCNAGAGELVRQEAERAGISLQMFVVGFEVDEQEAEAIKAIIAATPGVAYLNAPDALTLQSILNSIQAYIANPTGPALTAVLASAPAGEGEAPTAPTPATDAGEATAEATPAATESAGYQPQTACDHPYLPLRPGATWEYTSGFSISVQDVSGDLDNATASVAFIDNGPPFFYKITCSADGVIWLLADSTNQAGVFLPAGGSFAPGATWSNSYASGGAAETVSISFVAGAMQSLSVAGDTLDVIPVTGANSYGDTGALYFAKGVGIVRLEGNNPNLALYLYEWGSDLTSYKLPK